MNNRVISILAILSILGSGFYLGCAKNTKSQQAATRSGFRPKVDLLPSLEIALKEISKTTDLNRSYDLNASVSADGEWVFTFSFLPRTPSAEIIAVVGTNGVAIEPGL